MILKIIMYGVLDTFKNESQCLCVKPMMENSGVKELTSHEVRMN